MEKRPELTTDSINDVPRIETLQAVGGSRRPTLLPQLKIPGMLMISVKITKWKLWNPITKWFHRSHQKAFHYPKRAQVTMSRKRRTSLTAWWCVPDHGCLVTKHLVAPFNTEEITLKVSPQEDSALMAWNKRWLGYELWRMFTCCPH